MARPARAVAAPASLKGVLSALEAASALADGLRRGGVDADEAPVADGGDGTLEVLHAALDGDWREVSVSDPLGRPVRARWLLLRNRTAVVESAQAVGLGLVAPHERDPLRASSRGLGELLLAALEERPRALLVGLGGSATVDGGAGLLDVVGELRVPTEVACDVLNPLLGPRGAARAFGPQKGASPADVERLEARLAAMRALAPVAEVPGAGAAGGLGAALASLGARLVPGARLVLERIGFARRVAAAALVVTGEGQVDATTREGKAPAAVVELCREHRIRCAVFGGRIVEPLPGAELYALERGPERVREDLVELGERLGGSVLGAA